MATCNARHNTSLRPTAWTRGASMILAGSCCCCAVMLCYFACFIFGHKAESVYWQSTHAIRPPGKRYTRRAARNARFFSRPTALRDRNNREKCSVCQSNHNGRRTRLYAPVSPETAGPFRLRHAASVAQLPWAKTIPLRIRAPWA